MHVLVAFPMLRAIANPKVNSEPEEHAGNVIL